MSEARIIARHAGTVLVGQLAIMAFGVCDTIVAGRYSEQALAALSVGAAVYVSFFVALMGLLQALLPTWAELHGAKRHEDVGRSVRQALYLAALAVLAGATALLYPGPLLRWTEVPVGVQDDVRGYLSVLVLALPPALLFRMYSTLNQSLGKPKLVTMLQAASLLVKVPLTIWFAFGALGLPPQGAVGCAWATVVVHWLFLASAMWLLRTQPLYEPYAIWRKMERPHWPTLREFARVGIPGGLSVMVEVTSFTLMALFIARQGTIPTAAHQVASNLAAVLYMSPLSLGIATSARVSYWLGAGNTKNARLAIRTGLKLAVGIALASITVVGLARWQIASVYSSSPEVVAIAAGLLGWLVAFHLGDAIQGVCVFILRCYRVAIAPLVAYCVLLWGLGLAGGYALAYKGIGPFPAQNSPAAFWATAAIALTLCSALLLAMVWRAVRSYPETARA